MNIQFRDLISNAPLTPGIYKMYDSEDNLLYIGKAKNLFNRLKQYIDISHLENHKKIMRSLVTKVEWETTTTETEALLLEQKLIKELKPKYNVMLMDSKMYPMLTLTNHKYPRLLKFRGKHSEHKQTYGPYPSVSSLDNTIKTIQLVCKLRTCSDTFMNNRSRPCLLYQIGRCSAPCVLQQNAYKQNVEFAHKILSGNTEYVINILTKQMELYSSKSQFELAAKIRDRISILSKTLNQCIRYKQPYTPNINWNKNVYKLEKLVRLKLQKIAVFDNSHLFGKHPAGAMIVFGHNGFLKNSYKHFNLKDFTRAGNDIAMMEEFITRAIKTESDLDLIIVDGGLAQWNIANKTTNIPILGITKGIVRNGDEHFILPNGIEIHDLQKDSDLFLMLRQVRDEAHRFVISFHRKIRLKQLTSSCLNDISCIGIKRKKLLLQHFGSVQNIIEAPLQSFYNIKGIGKNIAQKIYEHFHS